MLYLTYLLLNTVIKFKNASCNETNRVGNPYMNYKLN